MANRSAHLDLAVERKGFKVGSVFYNGTTDILLGEHENGSPLGLALRDFWDSALEYLGDQYGNDMSGQPLPNSKRLPW